MAAVSQCGQQRACRAWRISSWSSALSLQKWEGGAVSPTSGPGRYPAQSTLWQGFEDLRSNFQGAGPG